MRHMAGHLLDTRANRILEITVAQTMLERTRHCFGLQPQRRAGDSTHSAVRLLKWLVDPARSDVGRVGAV
jgi:hypothetical protein